MDNLRTGRSGRRMFLNVKFIQITMSKVSTGQFFEAIKLHVHFSRYFRVSWERQKGWSVISNCNPKFNESFVTKFNFPDFCWKFMRTPWYEFQIDVVIVGVNYFRDAIWISIRNHFWIHFWRCLTTACASCRDTQKTISQNSTQDVFLLSWMERNKRFNGTNIEQFW